MLKLNDGTITKVYKKKTLTVHVEGGKLRLKKKGRVFRSLSEIAFHVTGRRTLSGRVFFSHLDPKLVVGTAQSKAV